MSCLCVFECVSVCVCLSKMVLQWCIYDTPFTKAGASCLSFFIPRSLKGLWWWWRDWPSPMPPWDEEGPPPPPSPPLPPEECCTLRSLFPSTRIYGKKGKITYSLVYKTEGPLLCAICEKPGELSIHYFKVVKVLIVTVRDKHTKVIQIEKVTCLLMMIQSQWWQSHWEFL